MFETILEKDNDVAKGRDRASHPFILALNNDTRTQVEFLDFTITLLGRSVEYAPYLYAAFVRAGAWGVLRDRVPFQIKTVKSQGKDLLDEHANFNFAESVQTWTPKKDAVDHNQAGEVLVSLKTPLRFKTRGRYIDDFNAIEFMACLHRRMFTMTALYGDAVYGEFYDNNDQLTIEQRNIRWKEMQHYSARQRNSMVLGGVVGDFILAGRFSPIEKDMLEFANLFHAGKNTSFGLGRISVWERLS